MIIRELEIYHFGKFHHKVLSIKPGVNIIYGGNEAGKSTIHRYIRAMLFGVQRLRGRAAANDEYTRMQPWDAQGYEGLMILEDRGRRYRLYRNFSKEREVFSVFDDITGAEIPLKTGSIEELIPGLNESNYRNTISIAQQGGALDDKFAASIQSYLANMSSGGDGNINIEGAMKYLAAEESAIRRRMPNQALEKARLALEYTENSEKQVSELHKGIYELTMAQQKLEGQLEGKREEIRHARASERQERVAGLHLLEERRQLLEKIAEIEADVNKRPDVGILKQKPAWLFVLFTVIALGLMGMQQGMHLDHMVLKICTGLFLIIAFICLGKVSFRRAEDVVDVKPYEQESLRIRNELKYYTKKYGINMDEPGELQHMLREEQELLRAQSELVNRKSRLEWELDQKEAQTVKRDGLERNYLQLKDEVKKAKTELEAVALARMVMNEVSGEIHQQFGTQLDRQVTEIFRSISQEAHQQVLVDEHLQVRLDGVKQQIALDRLSVGAIDQMYFALRSSAGKLIFQETEVPLVLDECFAHYDDERLTQCLRWIINENYPQIILFTCHHREAAVMKALGQDFHYIEL